MEDLSLLRKEELLKTYGSQSSKLTVDVEESKKKIFMHLKALFVCKHGALPPGWGEDIHVTDAIELLKSSI